MVTPRYATRRIIAASRPPARMRDRPRRFRAAARSGDESRAHCENRGESDIVSIAGIRQPRESRLRGMGMRGREDYSSISGQEKAAILLMSLGEEQAAKRSEEHKSELQALIRRS